MKHAAKHQKKIRKLLSGMDKSVQAPAVDAEPLKVMIEAIVGADAVGKQAEKALAGLAKEFVDFNELRVSPTKEIIDALGRDYPDARQKGVELVTSLNAVFNRHNALSLAPLAKMPKRDLRRHLTELGLSPYASGYLLLMVYEAHAVPVDRSLVDCLEIDECVEPGSSAEEVQGMLERTILQKHAVAAHLFFREYIAKSAKALARKRKIDAEARAAAEPQIPKPPRPAGPAGALGDAEAEILDEIELEEGEGALDAEAPAVVAPPPPAKGRKPEGPHRGRPPRKPSNRPPRMPKDDYDESPPDEDDE